MHFETQAEYFRQVRAPYVELGYEKGAKRTYRLVKAQDARKTFYLPHRENGKAVYRNHTLEPNTRYSTHADDDIFIAALKKSVLQVKYTPEREEALRMYGIPYEVELCKACGGKVKKLKYCPVEVIDEPD